MAIKGNSSCYSASFLSEAVKEPAPSGSINTNRVIKLLLKLPQASKLPVIGVALRLAIIKENEILDFFKCLIGSKRIIADLLAGEPTVLLSQPRDYEIIMNNSVHITKGLNYNSLKMWLNEGLLTSKELIVSLKNAAELKATTMRTFQDKEMKIGPSVKEYSFCKRVNPFGKSKSIQEKRATPRKCDTIKKKSIFKKYE